MELYVTGTWGRGRLDLDNYRNRFSHVYLFVCLNVVILNNKSKSYGHQIRQKGSYMSYADHFYFKFLKTTPNFQGIR